MIGKLIPAGPGMKRYSEVEVDYGENDWMMHGDDQPRIYEDVPAPAAEASEQETSEDSEPEEEPVVYGETVILE